jgi:hypothetical protein
LRKFLTGLDPALFGAEHFINFEIQSFFPVFTCIGMIAGYVTYIRVGGNVAFWIWTVPLAGVLIRIVAFHSPSIFESGITAGTNYFFGDVHCSAGTLISLANTANRCLNRMLYLGSVWSALSYSAGAFVSSKGLWPSLSTFIKRSGAPQ